MTSKDVSGFVAAGLCLAVILTTSLLAASAQGYYAGQGHYNPQAYSIPQNAQERADLYKTLRSLEGTDNPQAQTSLTYGDVYGAMDNPFAYKDPQANLEKARTYKNLQKLNSINYANSDSWYYWTNMWLNGPETIGSNAPKGSISALSNAEVYGVADNPFAYQDPQANLEKARTYKNLQKLNSINYGNPGADNWYYWANMWMN